MLRVVGDSEPEHAVVDFKPSIESAGLLPIALESLREPRRCRKERPCRLHTGAQVAEQARRGALVRLRRVVREAAPDSSRN